MNDVRLKKIIEECIGNNDPYWNNPVYEVVKKIINMSDGEESSVGKLLSNINDYGSTQLFDIDNTVTEVCNKLGIKLDKTKHAGQVSGLPWNIPFVIKRILKCPNCGAGLTYLMPSGSYLSCVKCKKIYTNEKGHVGHETSIDYDKNSNILY